MAKVHIYRRAGESRHWQAQVYVGGRRYRFTCLTSERGTAREYARQRADELLARHNRGLVGLPGPVRLSAVFSRYEREAVPTLRPSSQRRALGIVAEARSWFVSGRLHDPQAAHIRPDDVAAFLEAKRTTGVKPRTVNLYRATLHPVFRLCVRPWLLIQSNPVDATERLREEPREPRSLTEGAYARLVSNCGGHGMLRTFVTLAWETGARRGELMQLEWGDVDFERALLTFRNDPTTGRQTKGRRSRTVPTSDTALAALRDHAADYRLLAPASPYILQALALGPNPTTGGQVGQPLPGIQAGSTSSRPARPAAA